MLTAGNGHGRAEGHAHQDAHDGSSLNGSHGDRLRTRYRAVSARCRSANSPIDPTS